LTTKRWIVAVSAVRDASTSSFHLAMLIGAGLLLAGAIVGCRRDPEPHGAAAVER